MTYKTEDVEALVKAVGELVDDGIVDPTVAFQRLAAVGEAFKPFREKPPRVTDVKYYSTYPSGACKAYEPFKAIELTDAVKDALAKAGVEVEG